MEWLTARNSQSKRPRSMRSPSATSRRHGGDPVLLELLLDQGQRQAGPDDRDVGAFPEQVGHATDVVLVAVGQHESRDRVEAVTDPA